MDSYWKVSLYWTIGLFRQLACNLLLYDNVFSDQKNNHGMTKLHLFLRIEDSLHSNQPTVSFSNHKQQEISVHSQQRETFYHFRSVQKWKVKLITTLQRKIDKAIDDMRKTEKSSGPVLYCAVVKQEIQIMLWFNMYLYCCTSVARIVCQLRAEPFEQQRTCNEHA